MLKHIILILSLAAFWVSIPSFASSYFTTEEIKQSYKKHAILTQLHRWYLIYEEPLYGIKNQLDILDEDIYIKSSLGEIKGHDAYKEGIKQFPQTWQNAHHII